MTQPVAYDRSALNGETYFTTFSTGFPTTQQPGNKIDQELNAIAKSLSQHAYNIALIQRDDGELANETVGVDQLKAELQAGINPPSPWVTATDYSERDSVTINGILYRCIQAHISDVFATDLAAELWEEVIDFAELIGDIALSDSTPVSIGASVGSPGISDFASRADHVHPYTAPTVAVLGLADGGSTSGATTVAVNTKYLLDFSAAAFTVTLPAAPAAGDVILLTKFGTNTMTLGLNSLKFKGLTANPTSAQEGQSLLRYTGASRGWVEL